MTGPSLTWHEAQWRRTMAMLETERFPHALLLEGAMHGGTEVFLDDLRRVLLCPAAALQSRPCGTCRGCTLAEAGTHPDDSSVVPPEPGKSIGVDQIRELIEQIALSAALGGFKVGTIVPADSMTTAAANSLLKTLEEPPPGAVLVLLARRRALLPATIVSRCVRLVFPPVPPRLAIEWLQSRLAPGVDAALALGLAGNEPHAALRLAEQGLLDKRARVYADLRTLMAGEADPVGIAAQWTKTGVEEVIGWLVLWAMDLVRLHSARDASLCVNRDCAETMQYMVDRLDLDGVYALLDRCLAGRRMVATHPGLNAQMILEELALAWCAGGRAATSAPGMTGGS